MEGAIALRNGDVAGVLILSILLVVLLFAVWVGVIELKRMASQIVGGKGMSGEFAQGMILTAVIGVITSLLAGVTLTVKALVDKLAGRTLPRNRGDQPPEEER